MARRAIAIGVAFAVVLGLVWLSRASWIELLPTPLQQSRTVGSYFDRPPAWPGYTWERNGANIGWNELVTAAGPEHCDMQSMTMLTIGWPPGTRTDTAAGARQYIRDPLDKLRSNDLLGTWMRDPPQPTDLADSGYRFGTLKLFIAPSDQDRYVYVLAPADSERWPRSDPMTLCE